MWGLVAGRRDLEREVEVPRNCFNGLDEVVHLEGKLRYINLGVFSGKRRGPTVDRRASIELLVSSCHFSSWPAQAT